ncbi:DNA-methyltransferase [Aeribacillus pallidus]|uniref:DNA-methyltransferase n=1 Tax=Aeribacillus pallidus TaxID=33936 RepID=UPI003D1C24F3
MNFQNKISYYYEYADFKLILGDSLEMMKKFPSETFDMIFADPPYFLSSGGITCNSGRMVKVDKGEWDKSLSINEKHDFNKRWLSECKRLLKKGGTIWISGTYHNIYSIGMALEELEFKILNNIIWEKSNPSPNLSCRYFTHSTETILWAKRNKNEKHKFNYKLMKSLNNGKQMKDVWTFSTASKSEKKYGHHPTQKPLKLLERIIMAATDEGDLILDPFNGSGTTGIAASRLKRKYLGIDIEQSYLDITVNRLKDSFQMKFEI